MTMPYIREQPLTTVTEVLSLHTVYELAELAALVSISPKPTKKNELVAAIQSHLEGEKLTQLWTELDELQQAAVAEVVYSDSNYFSSEKFGAKYGKQPIWGASSIIGTPYRRQLSKLCLFFYGYELIMPDDLKERLRAFVAPPAPVKLETLEALPKVFQRRGKAFKEVNIGVRRLEDTVEEIPVTRCLMEQAAAHDLQSVLRLVSGGKVSVSDKTRYPNTATLKAIAPLLKGGDYYDDEEIGSIKSFAWTLILQAGGLVEGTRLQLTKAGQKALSEPPYQTLRSLWKKWFKTKLFDELRRINNIKGQTGKGQRSLTATEKRRNAIANALTDCPVGKWVAVSEFFRYMQAASYDFEVARNLDHLPRDNEFYADLGHYEGAHHWGIFQGRYALCLLFEYAATMGMLDVGYVHPASARQGQNLFMGVDNTFFFSRYDGLVFFRLTTLGAYCLGITDSYTPEAPVVQERLRVLPNLEVVATGEPLAPSEVLLLELYAEKVSDAVWRLTRDRLLDAGSQGHGISELQQFLLNLSGHPLPETVSQFLADIEARTNSLTRRGTAIVIDCTDSAMAVLIANDSRTKPYCMLAGDRSLVVPTVSESKFRNALLKLGYSLPK